MMGGPPKCQCVEGENLAVYAFSALKLSNDFVIEIPRNKKGTAIVDYEVSRYFTYDNYLAPFSDTY